MTELGDLVGPIDCYTATVTTEDGRSVTINRTCANYPNCG